MAWESWRAAARRRYRREAEARAVIEACGRSGETLTQFCRGTVSRATGSRGGRRGSVRRSKQGMPFHPVRLTQEAVGGAEIEVEILGGVTVRLGPGFDAEALRRVLAVLGMSPRY